MNPTAERVLLIDDGEASGALASALSAAGVAIHAVAAAAALETLQTSGWSEGAGAAVVILGAKVENRLALARAVHQAASSAHLVFLVEPGDVDALRQAMIRAPLLGAHWTVASGSPTSLAAQVQAVVRSTRQRLAFRASLDRINERRLVPSESDDVPRGLVVTNHYLASILEGAEDAIVAIERDGTVASWNQGAAGLFQLEPSAALGRSVEMLVDRADAPGLLVLLRTARGGTTVRNREMTCRRHDGTEFEGSLTLAPVRDEAGRIQSVSLILRDVTARRRHEAQIEALNAELAVRLHDVQQANAELASTLATLERTQQDLLKVNRELERQATTDPLTGLKNRIVFQSSLLEMIHVAERQSAPLSVLLIDVDHFKRVNDSLGHLEGDRALRAVAAALTAHVRKQDIVARFGGEEFAVLLPNTGLEDALLVAEKLRSGCCGAFEFTPELTVSIGVAAFEPGESEAALIGRADTALYASKAQGRNRVTVATAGMQDTEERRVERSVASEAPVSRGGREV